MTSTNRLRDIFSQTSRTPAETLGIIAAVTGVIGLLIAAVPLYWSYLCRSHGQYCEGSISAPGAVNDNRDKFLSRISTTEGQAGFERLLIKQRGYWLFGSRADVVANFRDGSQIIVDSIANDGDFEILNDLEDQVAVVLSKQTHTALASITAFFPNQRLTKRIFDLSCSDSLAHESDYVRVKNLTYSKDDRSFVFDVQTSCTSLSVNDAHDVSLSQASYDRAPFGANLVLELSKTFQVSSILSSKDQQTYKDSEVRFETCKKNSEQSKNKIEGELFACYKYRSTPGASLASLVIFQWSDGAFEELDSAHCVDGLYWMKDPKKKHIFVTCKSIGNDKANISLEIIGAPFDEERVYFFEGMCGSIDIWNPKFSGEEHEIIFELVTNCRDIVINDKAFKIASDDGKTRDMYRLVLSDHWLVAALAPWTTTSSIGK